MSQEPFDISNNAAESNLAPSHAYVSKKTKKEDVTSTAYTFTIVSVVGFILLILFGLDLLPFQSAAYSKTMILIVMGVMFAIFLFVGIHSFMELKSLSNAADREEQQFEEICQWFLDTYTAEKINADAGISDESEEQNYFLRYEIMKGLLLEKYPQTDASLLDHIIETIYDKIFLA
jgi:hypothetical protein